MNAPILAEPKSEAEDLAERTAMAVQYACRTFTADLAALYAELQVKKEHELEVSLLLRSAMEFQARVTYRLCIALKKDMLEAGKQFRLEAVQRDLRNRAMRATRSALQLHPTTP